MYNFKLIPSIGLSEKEFRDKIGQVKFDELYTNLLSVSKTCFGCRYEPTDKLILKPHLESWNGIDYKTAKMVLLCCACHSIKHIDVAVSNDWVRLCNSKYSQEELIQHCRKDALRADLANERVFILNRLPQTLVDDLRNIDVDPKKNEKIKIVFGKKFDWKK